MKAMHIVCKEKVIQLRRATYFILQRIECCQKLSNLFPGKKIGDSYVHVQLLIFFFEDYLLITKGLKFQDVSYFSLHWISLIERHWKWVIRTSVHLQYLALTCLAAEKEGKLVEKKSLAKIFASLEIKEMPFWPLVIEVLTYTTFVSSKRKRIERLG